MKRKIALVVAAGATALSLAAGPAAAAGPTAPGNKCQRTGMATVKGLGVFTTVAKSGVDAGTLKQLGVRGLDNFPNSTVFTLPEVLALHPRNPELFPWCD